MSEYFNKSFPEIDNEKHIRLDTATFCLGCFWGPDAEFGAMEGIVRTRVGYAGGRMPDPTYHNIGDHIETLQLDFDPQVISFEEISGLFWSGHNPSEPYWNRQYSKAIFYHNPGQREVIKMQKESIKSSVKQVNTAILEFDRFYIAENYHQKYHLQNVPVLVKDYRSIFKRMEDFINSTSAARVNGYLKGYGRVVDFENNLHRLGLSEESLNALRNVFFKYKKKVV